MSAMTAENQDTPGDEGGPSTIDPVCGMTVDPATAAARRDHDGRTYWFCGIGCAEAFDADPDRHAVAG